MSKQPFNIVVSGDICLNALHWVTAPQNGSALNWQNHATVQSVSIPGEAMLLARLVALATGLEIRSPQAPDLDTASPKEYLQAIAEIDLFPAMPGQDSNTKVYRLKNLLGFSGPANGKTKLLPIVKDDADADMVIIDDENNGFSSDETFWPLALKTPGKEPLVLYKMGNPNHIGPIWQTIEKHHLTKTIVVINSEDLRSKGVNISRGLSWERTAQDFVWQINNNPNLTRLAKCRHLIVLFGLEGAIYYHNDGSPESHLFFLPYAFEGSSFSDSQGKMSGFTSCFVASIARCIVNGAANNEDFSQSIAEGIRQGIVAAQKYFVEGFGQTIKMVTFPSEAIFIANDCQFICTDHVQDVPIRLSDSTEPWYILKDKSSANLAEIAYSIVKKGVQPSLKFIPIAQFGKLQTVDRTEIESYRSIQNLMCEYISTANTSRPLSIAVFGTPGSGKSFGITQVAASIAPDLIERLNFNLSQFGSPQELITAFHKVRDLSLDGKIPLVFFDEFDSAFEGKLGWLKYFLAPMQDGVFREGDSVHSIGKAIFVFAGGTSNTLQTFCGEEISAEEEQKSFLAEFKLAKGPDFLSRLRGYVNILGPNQTDPRTDQLFIIRRAMLLRSLLEKKVPHLIYNGEAQIDNGVLRALLKLPRYKHESRSMEAILDMSLLAKAKKWEQSHLPSKEQLQLHVDEEAFLRHLMHDTFYSEKIESLAMAIHEKYRELNEHNPYAAPAFIKPWEELEENVKNFTREQAKHIPDALMKIGYDVVSVKDTPRILEFTSDELDILAGYEQSYWYRYKKANGWKRGESLDWERRTDPDLVCWEGLSPDKKYNIYKMVKSWPEMLANASFKLERLRFTENAPKNS